MQVRDVMTHEVRLVRPSETIEQAARVMAEIDAGLLPVMDGDGMVGMISDRDIAVRAVARGLGKLTLSQPYRQWMNKAIADLSLFILPITVEYTDVQAGLPRHHGDPFDRLIVAQALVEKMPIISSDGQLDAYGITRIW